MSKKNLPLIIILILVASGLAYAKYSARTPKDMTSDQSMVSTVSEASQFAKAIESGEPTLCTLTKDQDKMEYLIKGKMMRVNTTTGNTMGHMINDSQYLYTWTDGQSQGAKMAVPSDSPSSTPAGQAELQPSEPPTLKNESDYDSFKNQGYTIDCHAGTASDSDFVPPSDINFIDPTAMMKQISPGTGGTVDIQKLQEQYGQMAK